MRAGLPVGQEVAGGADATWTPSALPTQARCRGVGCGGPSAQTAPLSLYMCMCMFAHACEAVWLGTHVHACEWGWGGVHCVNTVPCTCERVVLVLAPPPLAAI